MSHSDVQSCAVSIFRSDKVTVHFINRDGEKITVKGSPGESLLDVVINEDLDIDGFGMKTFSFVGLNSARTSGRSSGVSL